MTKYMYMKLVGLVLIIIGFSYCLTSFSNFWAYIYGDIEIANANIYVMSCGLILPLYMFIFGVYFYFYIDRRPDDINPFILISGLCMNVAGILRLFITGGVMEFIHVSFGFVLILFGLIVVFGCVKYKY